MSNITIRIEAPELVAAIEKLAAAMGPSATEIKPVAAVPAPVIPTTMTPPAMPPITVTGGGAPAPIPQSAVPLAVAPQPAAAPVVTPVPTSAPQYTFDQLAPAVAAALDAGTMDHARLQALLSEYGVPGLAQIPADKYGELAVKLRGMGVQI